MCIPLYPSFPFDVAGCQRDRYRSAVPLTPSEPTAADHSLEVQLQLELALAKAEREANTVRDSARRHARFRFIVIVLILLAMIGTFTYLSLQTLRSAFGA